MKTNLKERAGRLARYVIRLDEVHQSILSQPCSRVLARKIRLNDSSGSATWYIQRANGSRSTTGCKKIFTQDMKKTPMGVASMCRHYFGINPKMMPFLIKTAQAPEEICRPGDQEGLV